MSHFSLLFFVHTTPNAAILLVSQQLTSCQLRQWRHLPSHTEKIVYF